MRRQYVKIRENNRAFKSCLECDKYLGSEGLSKATLKNPNHFHERYNMHIDTISKEEYDSLTKNSDDTYRDIVHTYKIKCAYCGMLFHPTNVHQKFCDRHHSATCVVCGKEFDCTEYLKKHKRAPRTCSENCAVLERKQTIKEKQKDPNYEKQKLEKRRQTCIDKYGVDNVSKDPNIQKKIKDVIKEKYGVENISQMKVGNLNEWNKYKNDPEKYIKLHFKTPVTINDLCESFGVTRCSIYNFTPKDAFKYIKHATSFIEEEVKEFLDDNELEYVCNSRSFISPYELDLYIPHHKLAIECNPTFTHSSTNIKNSIMTPVPNSYHKMKTDMCEDKGIRLIHVFGYDWEWKRDIIKDIILNSCSISRTTIYARNCKCKVISFEDASKFLSKNHLQGYCVSSINVGLQYSNELVSVMTFGKPRHTIGNNKNADYELLRYCNKLGYRVVGGASKLLAYFKSNYDFDELISYSDRAHFSSSLYKRLGFKLENTSGPNYCWVNPNKEIRINRIKAQKQNITKLFDDVEMSKSQSQIMIEHGFAKVYDSGTCLWKLNN